MVLIRPTCNINETLTSYFQRIASANLISPYDLWRVVNKSSRYPDCNRSILLDCLPSTVININDLKDLLGKEELLINTNTFEGVLRKFLPSSFTIKEVASKRILSGLLSKGRRFCPICLKQKNYYKLIWQIEEIDYCHEHKIKLFNKCPYCLKPIPLLGSKSVVGICEHCKRYFNEARIESYLITQKEERFYQDWLTLLSQDYIKETYITGKKDSAIKLIYFLRNNYDDLNVTNNKSIIDSLYQTVRESKSNQSYTHLRVILHVLRTLNITMEEFLHTEVPNGFISSLLKKCKPIKDRYSCIAPWCKSFQKPGSLKRTSTSKKDHEDASLLHYYMYCENCASEYALDKESDNLIERGYFINLAWHQVRPRLLEGQIRKHIASDLDTTQNVMFRCAVFLYANGLITKDKLNLDLPNSMDENIKSTIIQGIKNGVNSKEIRKKMGLKEAEFLYYWFQPDVMLNKLTSKIPKPAKKGNLEDNISLVKKALQYLLENNTNITVKEVCNYIGFNHETIRYWGALPLIKEAKEKQKDKIKIETRILIIKCAEFVVRSYKENGEKLLSDKLYEIIGINRRVLVRNMPEVTKYISNLIKT